MFGIFRLVVLLVIVAAWFVASPTKSYACSCVQRPPPAKELANSTAVFAGKMVKVVRMDRPTGQNVGGGSQNPLKEQRILLTVIFQVDTVWKGPSYENLVVTTPLTDTACGYQFQQGEKYLVYAYGSDVDLQTNSCKRTQLLSGSGSDLEELGQGKTPQAGSNVVIPEAPPEPTATSRPEPTATPVPTLESLAIAVGPSSQPSQSSASNKGEDKPKGGGCNALHGGDTAAKDLSVVAAIAGLVGLGLRRRLHL